KAHPDLEIVLNGGITSIEQGLAELDAVDGVMMGRVAYQEPWRLLAVDPLIFDAPVPAGGAKAAAQTMLPYIARAPSADISQPKRSSRAPMRMCSSRRSRW